MEASHVPAVSEDLEGARPEWSWGQRGLYLQSMEKEKKKKQMSPTPEILDGESQASGGQRTCPVEVTCSGRGLEWN